MSKHRYFDGHGKSSHPHGTHGNDVLIGSKHNDRIDGGRGDDILSGGAGNDILRGNSGKDVLLGGSGNDILYGDDKSGHGGPFSWLWVCKPAGYVDYLDGGSGSDKVYGGAGNDFANYTMAENLRAHDIYDGGRGADSLQLKLTYGEFALDSVKQDIARFEAFLASHASPLKDNGATFHFNSFNLDVSDFEKLKIDLVNTGPTAKNDAGTTNEDSILTVPKAAGVLANDTDADRLDVLHVTGFSHTSALGAAVVVNADGSYSYDPTGAQVLQALAQGASVTDSFTYTVADLAGATSSATVKIKVTGVDDGPVAHNDAYTATEDQVLTVPSAGVLGNDTASTPLHAVLVAGPEHGLLSLNDNGSFVYTPNADFNGSDRFSYRANDGSANSATAWVSISVAAVNDTPASVEDSYSLNEDTTLTVAGPGVLGNDTDIDNTSLHSLLVDGPDYGSLTLSDNGSFVYTPDANFNGTDSFSYRANDGSANSETARVNISVAAVNDAPVSVEDSYSLNEDTTLTVAGPGVLANDTDVDNTSLHSLLVDGPDYGTLTLNTDGSFVYTPDVNFHGIDSFTYRTTDGSLNSEIDATVNLTIASINDAPVAVDDTAATDEDTAISGNVLTPINGGADTDVEGDTLTVSTTGNFTSELGAAVTLNADGTFTYDPAGSATLQALGTGASEIDHFAYSISDGHGGTRSATVNVTVAGADEPSISGPVLDSVPPTAEMHSFMRVEGGDWLELDSFSTGLLNNGTIGSGGGGAGKSSAQDVNVLLGSSAEILALTDALVRGDLLKSVEIETYVAGEKGLQLVDEFKFNDVLVTNLANGNGVANSLSFDYRSFTHGHGTQNDATGWDFVHNTELTGDAPQAEATDGPPAEQVSSAAESHSFVRIGDGDWLELDMFGMSQENTGSASTGGGAGSGKALADEVFLHLGSSAQILALTSALASGDLLKSVEIETYVAGEKGLQLVDEFKFNDVLVTDLANGNGLPGTLSYDLSFDYRSFTHGHGTQNDATGWDFVHNTALTGDAPQAEATEGPPAEQVSPNASLDYYVHFDGADGWLRLDSFGMALSNSGTIGSGSGGGAGKSSAQDVNVLLGSSAEILALTDTLVRGDLLKNVEIEAYLAGEKGLQLVDEFRFNNVLITGLASDNANNNSLSFDFASFSHGHVARDDQGTEHNSVTGWDFVHNTALAGDAPKAQALGDITDQIAPGEPLHSFMRVEGGDWLELDSFSTGLLNNGTIGSGGGGAGKSSAQDVNVLLGSSAEILALTDALVRGDLLKSVEIETYVAGEKGLQLVDEFKFNDVLVTNLANGNGVANSLSFDYRSFTHGHGTQNDATGWDFVHNTELTGDAPQAEATDGPPAEQVSSAAESHSFVRIGDGDWLELDMFGMSQENTGSASTGGGAGSGKALADEVFLHLGSSAQILALTSALASGDLLKSVEIETYVAGEKGLQLVDEFKFNDVLVTDLANGNGLPGTLSYDLSFDYRSFTHGHGTQNDATGWDFVHNTALTGDAPQAEATEGPPAEQVSPNASLDYYVHFDGADGWLRLDSFGMALSNSGTIGSGSGGGAGKSSAQDVNVLLGSSAEILALTDTLVRGDLLKNVEIEAYLAGEKGLQLVDEFRFNNVLITGLASDNANNNSLSFDFASFSHGHVARDDQGTEHNSVTGWDFVHNTALAATLPHADVDFFA